jgi:hypothetical protein
VEVDNSFGNVLCQNVRAVAPAGGGGVVFAEYGVFSNLGIVGDTYITGNWSNLLTVAAPFGSGSFYDIPDSTGIHLIGIPNFSQSVIFCVGPTAQASYASVTTGTATGVQFIAGIEGNLNIGGDLSFFPGDIPGFMDESCFIFTFDRPPYDPNFEVATPLTGSTVSMVLGQHGLVLDPAATLAGLTINLPPSPQGAFGVPAFWHVYISSTQIITSLTVASTDCSTVKAAPSILAAGQAFSMIYDPNTTTWYPTA